MVTVRVLRVSGRTVFKLGCGVGCFVAVGVGTSLAAELRTALLLAAVDTLVIADAVEGAESLGMDGKFGGSVNHTTKQNPWLVKMLVALNRVIICALRKPQKINL